MGDRIALKEGDLPWQPQEAEIVAILHEYDMPLTGVIEQHGTPFFFWCIRGEVTQGTVWGYAPLGDQEREEIRTEPRDQALRRIFATKRPYTVAFSVEDRGIVKWRDIDPRIPESALTEAAIEFLGLSDDEMELLETV